jgi:signal transduction histidine kinase
VIVQGSVIEQELNKSINEMYRYIEFLGQKISEKDFNYKTESSTLFKRKHTIDVNLSENNFVHWGSFNLVDKDGKILVYGGDESYVVNDKDFISESVKNPWSIIFFKPVTIGKYKKYKIVPVAVSITNNEGHYIGTIVTSLLLEVVSDKIREVLKSDDNIYYEILDISGHSYFSSHPHMDETKLHIVSQIRDDKYPLIIKIGYDEKKNLDAFFTSLSTQSGKLFLLGGLMTVLLYFFYRKIISPVIDLSNYARKIGKMNPVDLPESIPSKEFNDLLQALRSTEGYKRNILSANAELHDRTRDLDRTRLQLEELLESNYESDDIKARILKEIRLSTNSSINYITSVISAIKSVLQNESMSIPKPKLLNHIENIEQEIENIVTFTTGALNEIEFDINKMMEECISIIRKSADRRNITIHYLPSENLGSMKADKTRLSQVIISLLRRSVEFLNDGGKILLTTDKELIYGNNFFVLQIEDNGYGIPEEKRQELSQTTKKDTIEGVDLPTDLIRKLVELHDGILDINDTWKKGSKIVLKIPYNKKRDDHTPRDSKIVNINFRKNN